MKENHEEEMGAPIMVSSAAAPTTDESSSSTVILRANLDTKKYRKGLLVRAVTLGLTVARAARIAKIRTPSAHLALQKHQATKRAKSD